MGKMKKGIMGTILVLMTAVFFAFGVWGQENSSPGSFSGTITKIDPGGKEFVVQDAAGNMIFQWDKDTRVNGPGEKILAFKDLKEGMTVTVLYRVGERNRIASRVEVKKASLKALKGINLPFECGAEVC